MELTTAPPPPPQSTTAAAAYPDSLDSSPRSRNTDSWGEDNSLYPSKHGSAAAAAATAAAPVGLTKLRLMCSYGGHIVPRPHDKSLCYVGGDTRIVVVDRHTTLSELTQRLSKTLLRSSSSSSISSATSSSSFTLKYQLPSEDLDSLISVTTDEDLENMIEEYERLNSSSDFNKSARLRLFLFPAKPDSVSSIGSLLENSIKSEDWFLNALNGTTSGFSDTSSVNCLLGLDEEVSIQEKKDVNNKSVIGKNLKGNNSVQDVHSIPDSPMLERSSSFGSASSAPSLASLPPIRVHVDDNQKIGGGIEEQFSQMSVQQQHQKLQEDGGFVAPPSQVVVTGVPINSAAAMAEYPNRVFSDDERSEQGLQMAYRNQQQQHQSQQQQQQQQQYQQKQSTGFDMASPDSVSSDGNRQKPSMIFQDPMLQMQYSNSNNQATEGDQNTRIQMQQQQQQQQQQQIQDSAYVMSMSNPQIDPQHSQLHHHQPQFIRTAIPPQYIQSHPSGAVPMASYYPMYPSQGQHHPHHQVLDQQNYVYYMPAAQAPQGYNLPLQQQQQQQQQTPNQAPPPSGAYTATRTQQTASKSELPSGYTKSGAPQLVQVPSSQHQPQSQSPFMGYSQIHHQSQSIASSASGTGGNYGYEFTDPAQQVQHIYYAPQSIGQYQTMASNLPVEPADQQQARTSQP